MANGCAFTNHINGNTKDLNHANGDTLGECGAAEGRLALKWSWVRTSPIPDERDAPSHYGVGGFDETK